MLLKSTVQEKFVYSLHNSSRVFCMGVLQQYVKKKIIRTKFWMCSAELKMWRKRPYPVSSKRLAAFSFLSAAIRVQRWFLIRCPVIRIKQMGSKKHCCADARKRKLTAHDTYLHRQ